MYNYIRNILEQLDLRCSHNSQLPHTSSFIHLLKALKPSEKDFIADYVMKKEWNLGSPNVLNILQQSCILSVSDYLYKRIETDNPVEVQLVICDLLETQFSLLASLIHNFDRTDPKSQLVSQCVEEGFRRFVEDLVVRGDCVKTNYLQELKVRLSAEQLCRLRMMHLNLLLNVDDCSLVDAIGRLSGWMENSEFIENSGLNMVINEILHDKEKVLDYLMKKVTADSFHGWKWYSNVLKKICSDLSDHSVKTIKSFLKELFASFLTQKNQNYLFIMMLTARIVCYGDRAHFGEYQHWYRGQFADLKYLISKDDFVSTIEVLESLVSYENDVDILEIYARVSIAPPTMCNDMVLSYKQMCRSKIERLSSHNRTIGHDVVLVASSSSDEMEF